MRTKIEFHYRDNDPILGPWAKISLTTGAEDHRVTVVSGAMKPEIAMYLEELLGHLPMDAPSAYVGGHDERVKIYDAADKALEEFISRSPTATGTVAEAGVLDLLEEIESDLADHALNYTDKDDQHRRVLEAIDKIKSAALNAPAPARATPAQSGEGNTESETQK